VRDAGLIAAAQRVEHYEIAGYGCVRSYAEVLGDQATRDTLQRTLDEKARPTIAHGNCEHAEPAGGCNPGVRKLRGSRPVEPTSSTVYLRFFPATQAHTLSITFSRVRNVTGLVRWPRNPITAAGDVLLHAIATQAMPRRPWRCRSNFMSS
jgi:hypothetical protein